MTEREEREWRRLVAAARRPWYRRRIPVHVLVLLVLTVADAAVIAVIVYMAGRQ